MEEIKRSIITLINVKRKATLILEIYVLNYMKINCSVSENYPKISFYKK
jgi:hypothetical protein